MLWRMSSSSSSSLASSSSSSSFICILSAPVGLADRQTGWQKIRQVEKSTRSRTQQTQDRHTGTGSTRWHKSCVSWKSMLKSSDMLFRKQAHAHSNTPCKYTVRKRTQNPKSVVHSIDCRLFRYFVCVCVSLFFVSIAAAVVVFISSKYMHSLIFGLFVFPFDGSICIGIINIQNGYSVMFTIIMFFIAA